MSLVQGNEHDILLFFNHLVTACCNASEIPLIFFIGFFHPFHHSNLSKFADFLNKGFNLIPKISSASLYSGESVMKSFLSC
ncbi:hypothetical protein IKI14_06580 [bacterium]|nr:hypothetical protein [bacterium]